MSSSSSTTAKTICSLIGGEPQPDGAGHWDILNPYDGQVVRRAIGAGDPQIETAIATADRARRIMGALSRHERAAILDRLAGLVTDQANLFTRLLCEEAGKPVFLGKQEVARCAEMIRDAAACTRRPEDEMIPIDASAYGAGRQGLLKRFPLGVVAAITPFNFPLNLVAHKIAPAIAAGCPVVLKPASQTPSLALELVSLALQAGLPPEAISVLLLRGSQADRLVTDNRIALVTFTGSGEVGWGIKARCGKKKVALELGGNAAAVIEPDSDLEHAAQRVAAGAFGYAGQSCISVQRVFVHEAVADAFIGALTQVTRQLPTGDPAHPDTICGPLIDHANAERVEEWIARARARGASLVTGGIRDRAMVTPAILTGVPSDCAVSCDEVFGPVVTVDSYSEFDDALARVNDSRYGLQAGLFTNDWQKIWRAFRTLAVGGVIHNDIPTFRVDLMPYGGIKDSGFGREGARWSIHEMTEPRLLVLSTPQE